MVSTGSGVDGLDALVGAALVGPLVLAGGVVVVDVHRVDIHGEGSLAVVGLAAGPLDGSLAVVGVTTGPDADAEAHGSLWEARAALGVLVGEGAHALAVDQEVDGLLGPVDRVGVPGLDGGRDLLVGGAVVGGGVTLAEVVGFDLVVVAAEALLISLA